MNECPYCNRPIQHDQSCDCDDALFEYAINTASEFLTIEDVIGSYEKNRKTEQSPSLGGIAWPGMGDNFGDNSEPGADADRTVQLLSRDGVDTQAIGWWMGMWKMPPDHPSRQGVGFHDVLEEE